MRPDRPDFSGRPGRLDEKWRGALEENERKAQRSPLQQEEQVVHGLGLDMGIAQQRLGATMAHESLHADEGVAHLQTPARERMAQGVQRQLGGERFKYPV